MTIRYRYLTAQTCGALAAICLSATGAQAKVFDTLATDVDAGMAVAGSPVTATMAISAASDPATTGQKITARGLLNALDFSAVNYSGATTGSRLSPGGTIPDIGADDSEPRGGGGVAPDPQPGTSPLPEPGTWLMTILGFGLAGAALRRRPAAPIPA